MNSDELQAIMAVQQKVGLIAGHFEGYLDLALKKQVMASRITADTVKGVLVFFCIPVLLMVGYVGNLVADNANDVDGLLVHQVRELLEHALQINQLLIIGFTVVTLLRFGRLLKGYKKPNVFVKKSDKNN